MVLLQKPYLFYGIKYGFVAMLFSTPYIAFSILFSFTYIFVMRREEPPRTIRWHAGKSNSAMFTFAIWSRFSPPEFPNVWSAVSFCSNHASVLHGFSFLCLRCGNCLAGFVGTIQEEIVDEGRRQPQQM